MKKYFFIFSIVFSLFGCEGENGGNGIVYDSITNIPLDIVQYRCIETKQIEYTDSLGQWEMYGPFGGCLPDGPPFGEPSSRGLHSMMSPNGDTSWNLRNTF